MKRILYSLLVASLPFGGVLADAPKSKDAKVTLVYQHELPNVPGKSIKGVLVEYGPGGYSPGHTHPKSAFIYATVLEGEILSQVNDGQVTTYKAGQSFSELPGDRHSVSAIVRPRMIKARQSKACEGTADDPAVPLVFDLPTLRVGIPNAIREQPIEKVWITVAVEAQAFANRPRAAHLPFHACRSASSPVPASRNADSVIFQVSTSGALVAGVYDREVSVQPLLEHTEKDQTWTGRNTGSRSYMRENWT